MNKFKSLLLPLALVAGLHGAPAQANPVETPQPVVSTVAAAPSGGFVLPLITLPTTPYPGGGATTQNDKPCAGC